MSLGFRRRIPSYIFRFKGALLRAHCVLKARGAGIVGGDREFLLGRFLGAHCDFGRKDFAVVLQGHCSGSAGSSEGELLPGALPGDLLLRGDVFGLLVGGLLPWPGESIPLLGDSFPLPGDSLPLLGLLDPNSSRSSSLLHFVCLEMFLDFFVLDLLLLGLLRLGLLPLSILVAA